MIGHYLMTLTPAQEDRLLTEVLAPGGLVNVGGSRCLIGVAEDWRYQEGLTPPKSLYEAIVSMAIHIESHDKRTRLVSWGERLVHGVNEGTSVPERFDKMCYRFGVPRITRAIRNRILTNQAWRALAPTPELVAVEV